MINRIVLTEVMLPGELDNVALKVLRTDLVVDALVCAFERGPKGFDPVGMNHILDVFPDTVIDRLMVKLHTLVSLGFIDIDLRSFRYVASHESLKRFFVTRFNDLGSHFIGVMVPDTCRSSKPHRPQKSWHFSPLPTTVCYMKTIVMILVAFVHEIVLSRATLQLENVALRQQVAVLKRERPRPRLHPLDRVFWVLLFHLWPRWKDALVIVKPETVIGWHRRGFRLFWKWKSCHGKPGRPRTSKEIRELIQRMSRENPLWGAPRNHGELLKLGIDVSQATVTRYMVRHPKPPSQTWRTFLDNHVGSLVSIDFFVVPTARFAVLFVFIVLRHERRRIEHFGVTAHPSADWVAQQMREAFPWDTAPRYLIRDRDGAYGKSFRSTIMAMGAKEVVTAPRRPWQNPYVERLIGSVKRECLNHVIILNERHLRRVLVSYLDYYHRSRTHLSLGKDTPEGRPVQPGGSGKIVSFPQVGGLHHRYERLAA